MNQKPAKVLILILGLLFISSLAMAFPARFGVSPDDSEELLLSAIGSAKHSLLVNIYEFDSPEIRNAIIDRIKSGVAVQVLIEGEPVTPMSAEGKNTITLLRKAIGEAGGAGNHLFLMKATRDAQGNVAQKRRFRWDHAKYLVVDGKAVLIASENFTHTGHPTPGIVGNRGWETLLEDASLAKSLESTFSSDTELSHGDVVELSGDKSLKPTAPVVEGKPARKAKAFPVGGGDVSHAQLVFSPNSLSGIQTLIQSAKKSLEVEHMSLPSTWRDSATAFSGAPKLVENPILTEILNAARRGVQTRVILNDESVFGGGNVILVDPNAVKKKTRNEITAEILQSAADCESLPVQAKIIDIKATEITYVHNKGVIVDGQRAFVSSINGTQNSVENNRELGVVLESPAAAAYYTAPFNFDWENSGELKLKANCRSHVMDNPLQVVQLPSPASAVEGMDRFVFGY